MLDIAQSYESYGRVDAPFRWAPELCVPLRQRGEPPAFGISTSDDSSTHGRKMYTLFAKKRPPQSPFTTQYVFTDQPNPVGQVVVKEAWLPEEVPDKGQTAKAERVTRLKGTNADGTPCYVEDWVIPFAYKKHGRLFHAKEKSALFIMFKMHPETPGTDEGWVYGTVTSDGKRVLSAGKVKSCMECHRRAPYDRLFGLAQKK